MIAFDFALRLRKRHLAILAHNTTHTCAAPAMQTMHALCLTLDKFRKLVALV